jgi:hypothetical protein
MQKPQQSPKNLTQALVQLALPMRPESRSSPDAFWKSPLFGCVAKNNRRTLKPSESLTLVDCYGYRIVLTGGLTDQTPGPFGRSGEVVAGLLSQADHTVFIGLLHLAEGRLGTSVDFEPYRFLRAIGLPATKASAVSLFRSISRMRATHLFVSYREKRTGDHIETSTTLINGMSYNKDTHRYRLSLDPELAGLFGPANYTTVNFKQRLALKGDMARFLHGLFTSDKSGFLYHIANLQNAYNYTGEPRKFRFELKTALDEIATETGWRIDYVPGQPSLRVDKSRRPRQPELV